jgi:hypothetical protein
MLELKTKCFTSSMMADEEKTVSRKGAKEQRKAAKVLSAAVS